MLSDTQVDALDVACSRGIVPFVVSAYFALKLASSNVHRLFVATYLYRLLYCYSWILQDKWARNGNASVVEHVELIS